MQKELSGELFELLRFYAFEGNWPKNPTLGVNTPKCERDNGDRMRDYLDRVRPGWREE